MAYNPVICAGSGGGPIAVWDQTAFLAAYPNFSTVPGGTLEATFDIATLYLRNDGTSPIRTLKSQTSLMYMLTAHLLTLTFGIDGAGASGGGTPGVVGRISSANEGSVSVSTDYPSTPSSAWFVQTPYGANFWQATVNWRRGRYIPGPTRFGNGIGANSLGGGFGFFPGRRTR